jgi:DNA-binding CsgD family transcriptional regulator
VSVSNLDVLFGVVVLIVLIAVWFWRRRRVASKSFSVRVVGNVSAHAARTWLWDSLTPRETQVARLVAQGLRNADIARELCISVNTVESHLKHIYAKLDVHSRVELAHLIRDLVD